MSKAAPIDELEACTEPLCVEALEPRVLYSADILSAFLPTLPDSFDSFDEALSTVVPVDSDPVSASGTPAPPLSVIDARVPDPSTLIDTLRAAGHDVLLVDIDDDAIERISEALAGDQGRSGVHVFAHGDGGGVQLGDQRIDASTLIQRSDEIGRWSESLDDTADILLWACELGATPAGQDLVDALARLTGADLAASDDVTGHHTLGGDWDLETRVGRIDASSLAIARQLGEWQGALRTISVTTTDDGLRNIGFGFNQIDSGASDITLREAIQAINKSGDGETGTGPHVIELGAGTYRLTIDGDNENWNEEGDLDILSSMTIRGISSSDTILIQERTDRLLDVQGNTVVLTLESMAVQGGGSPGREEGGALRGNASSTIVISAVHFSDNHSDREGGAINSGGSLRIEDSLFTDNRSANSGGAVFANGDLVVERTTFERNKSLGDKGGAVFAGAPIATVRLSDLQFNANASDDDGGGVYLENDGAVLDRVTFHANEGKDGGALALRHDNIIVSNATFLGNIASNDGGAIHADRSFTVTASTFVGNEAVGKGGAISLTHDDVVTVYSSLFVDNRTDDGVADSGFDILGDVESLGYNLFESLGGMVFTNAGGTVLPTDVVSTEPARDVVADTLKAGGGYVTTLALPDGSIAIDAGGRPHPTITDDPDDDANQRTRDEIRDIGASESTSPGEVLFYADDTGKIWRSTSELTYPQLIVDTGKTGINAPRDLEVDIAAGYLFWLSDDGAQLWRSALDDLDPPELLGVPAAGAAALALDPTARRIYVLRGGASPGIDVHDYDGILVGPVAGGDFGIDSPGDLAFDQRHERLIWTQSGGGSPGLYLVATDGTGFRQIVMSTALIEPDGLAVDSAGHNLYLVDDGLGRTILQPMDRDATGAVLRTGDTIVHGYLSDTVVTADVSDQSVIRMGDTLGLISGPNAVSEPIVSLSIGATSGTDAAPVVSGSLSMVVNQGASAIIGDAILGATDDQASASQLTWTVTDTPYFGSLYVNGQKWSDLSDEARYFTQQEIASNVVQYRNTSPLGIVPDQIVLEVDDGRTGAVSVTIAIDVRGTNSPPALTTQAVALSQGQTTLLTSAMLSISDPDGIDPDTRLRVDTGTSGITWHDLTSDARTGDVSWQQILDGDIELRADDREVGDTPLSFAFNVEAEDSAGGSDAQDWVVTFSNVNDAPVLSVDPVSVDEAGSLLLSPGEFDLTDSDGINAATRFDIDTDVANTGLSLYARDTATTVSGFTWQQLQDGEIELRADDREPSGAAHTLSVSVDDTEGGTATVDWLVTVTPTNDPLQLTTTAMTLQERGSIALDTSTLQLSDNDGVDSASVYTWDPLDAGLSIVRLSDGSPLVSFTQQQLIDGEIAIAFDDTEPDPAGYSIALQVEAGDGEQATAVLSVTVQNVNDAPVLFAAAAAVDEAGSRLLSSADLALSDADGVDPDTRFVIDTDEANTGLSLYARDTATTVADFTWQQLRDGEIELRADGREPSGAAHTLTVNVDDTDGGAIAVDWSVTVTPTNDPLQLITSAVSLQERGSTALDTTTLQLSDNDGVDSASVYTWDPMDAGLSFVRLSDGSPLVSFTQQQLIDGEIALAFDDTEPDPAGYSIALQVEAGDGEQATAVLSVTVQNVNDAPVLIAAPVAVDEAGSRLLSSIDLALSDADGVDPGTRFDIDTDEPNTGLSLYARDTATTVADFTWQQLQDGEIELRADGREPSGAAHTLTVNVDDTDGGAIAVDWSVTVTPTNDPLQLITSAVSLQERGSIALDTTTLQLSDNDGVDSASVYTWDPLDAGLSFVRLSDGSPLVSFTQQQLIDGEIAIAFDDTEPDPAGYSIALQVEAGDGEQATAVLSVTVQNVNDAPVLTAVPVTVGEGVQRRLSVADLVVSDADGIAPMTRFSVDTDQAVTGLSLFARDSGTTVSSFTWQQLQNDQIELVADDREPSAIAHTFTVSVDDTDGGTATASWSVTVTQNNDALALITTPLALLERGSTLLDTTALQLSDNDGIDMASVYTWGPLATGLSVVRQIDGAPLVSFTQQQLIDDEIAIAFDDTEPASTPYTVSMQVEAGNGERAAAALSISVENVNDAPVLSPSAAAVDEGGSRLLSSIDLALSDADGIDPDTRFDIDTDEANTGLSFYARDTATTVADFTWQRLQDGEIELRADDREPSGAAHTLSVSVDDTDGGSATVDWLVTVTPTNDPLQLTTTAMTLQERGSIALDTTTLQLSDNDGVDSASVYTWDPMDAGLSFVRLSDGSPLVSFTQQQLIDGEIALAFDDTEPDPAGYSIALQVEAGDGEQATAVLSVTVQNVNDAPVLVAAAAAVDEAGSRLLSSADLALSDADGVDPDTRFDIDTDEANTGLSLYARDTATTVADFTWQRLQDGEIELRADDREPSGAAHTLSVSVDDTEGGTATVDWLVTVTPTNDPLQLTTTAMTLQERGSIALDTSTLQLSDNDGVDSASVYTWDPLDAGLSIVRLSDGSPLVSFTQQQLIDGEIAIAFDDTEPDPAGYSIALQVEAGDGEQATAVLSVTVQNVNDTPELIAAAVAVDEAGSRLLSSVDLVVSDADGIDPDTRFDIDTDQANTGLSLYGRDTGTTINSFTWQQLQDGEIELRADGREPSGAAHTLSVSVDDTEGGTATVDWLVTVTPTNDPLQLITSAVSLQERGSTALDTSTLQLSDNDGVDSASVYTWDPLDAGLSFVRQSDGSPLVSFTQQQLIDDEIALAFDDTEPEPAGYAIALQVEAGDGEQATAVLSVTVQNVNDAPVLIAASVAVDEAGSRPLSSVDLAVSDADGIDPDTRFDIDTDQANTGLSLYARDTATTVSGFTWQQLQDGEIELRADDREPTGAAHTLSVSVDDTDGGSATVDWLVTVTPTNDPLQLITSAVSLPERGSIALDTTTLQLSDNDGVDSASVYTWNPLDAGLSFVRLSDGSPLVSFTQQQLIDGEIALAFDDTEPDPAGYAIALQVEAGDGEQATAVLSVTVQNVNDAPVLIAAAAAVDEAGSRLLSSIDLALSDADGVDPDTRFDIDTDKANTGLSLYGRDTGTTINSFTWQQLQDGEIELRADDREPTGGAHTLSVSVGDTEGGTATVDWLVTVTPTNDPLQLITSAVSLPERGSIALDTTTLQLSDNDGVDSASVYTWDALDAGLSFVRLSDGSPLVSFTQQQLIDGEIAIAFDDTEPDPAGYSIALQVEAGDGEQATAVLSVTVQNVNDAPVLMTADTRVEEGSSRVLSMLDLSLSDEDGIAPGARFEIDTDESDTGLSLFARDSGSTVTAFTWQQLQDGLIELRADDREPSGATLVLMVSVDDAAGGRSAEEWRVTVDSRDDGPVIEAGTGSIDEGSSLRIGADLLSYTDEDESDADRVSYRIETDLSETGLRFASSADGEAITRFNQRSLDAGVWIVHDGSERHGTVDIAISVGDGVSRGEAGSGRGVLSIRIDAVNDAPVANPGEQAVALDARSQWQLPDALFTDVDSPTLNYRATTLEGDSLPQWLGFDPTARRFEATQVPAGLLSLGIRVTAADGLGAEASTVISLTFDEPALEPAQPAVPAAVELPVFAPVATVSAPRPTEVVVATEPPAGATAPTSVPSDAVDGGPMMEEGDFTATTTDLRALIESLPRVSRPSTSDATSVETSVTIRTLVDREVQQNLDTLDLEALIAQLAREGREADPQLLDALQREKERLEERAAFAQTAVGGSIAVSSGLSIGYLIWLIRGGTLAGSVLSSLPAWRFVDPLPVLGTLTGDGQATDTESLQSLVETDERVSR